MTPETLDKEKTIKYLQKVAGLHYDQLTPFHDGWNKIPLLTEDCQGCMEEMSHGFKREFAKMLIAKIQLGDLDGKQ